jgi:hypothetical protein
MAGAQAFALQQVGDQVAHQRQVPQQCFARRGGLTALRQQFCMQACPRQRAAQFVTDRQQQRALGLQHAVDIGRHAVHVGGQLAQFVIARHGNRPAEITRAKPPRAGADVVQRAQQPPHIGIGQQRKQQQCAQRGPADIARPLTPGGKVQTEINAVAVCRAARQQARRAAFGRVVHPVFAAPAPLELVWMAAPVDLRPADAHRDWQALGDRASPPGAGRRSDLRRQAVHIVHHQGTRRLAPAGRQRLLHAEHECAGQRQGQQEK